MMSAGHWCRSRQRASDQPSRGGETSRRPARRAASVKKQTRKLAAISEERPVPAHRGVASRGKPQCQRRLAIDRRRCARLSVMIRPSGGHAARRRRSWPASPRPEEQQDDRIDITFGVAISASSSGSTSSPIERQPPHRMPSQIRHHRQRQRDAVGLAGGDEIALEPLLMPWTAPPPADKRRRIGCR